MREKEKRKIKGGFLGSLLRSGSLAFRGAKNADDGESFKEKGHRRRAREGEDSAAAAAPLRASRQSLKAPRPRSRRRQRRFDVAPEQEPEPTEGEAAAGNGPRTRKGKRAVTFDDMVDDGTDEEPSLITRQVNEWPPKGMSNDDALSPQQAQDVICRGAPIHKGHRRPVAHAPEHCYALYTTTSGSQGAGTDAADPHAGMTQLMTMRTAGRGKATCPWETFEQPSCAFTYGSRPGTITLNHWAATASVRGPPPALRDPGVAPPRQMDLARVLDRMRELQRGGLEDDEPALLYRILYRRLLRDPDRLISPHRTLDRQMTDLILVLSRPGWIDFTKPENQVAARFLFDPSHGGGEGSEVGGHGGDDLDNKQDAPEDDGGEEVYRLFMHQLLLSIELDLRIHSPQHGDWAKETLLQQMPPTILWNLALARRWRDNVRVDRHGTMPQQTQLRFKLRRRQVKMIRRFAQTLKWPNLGATLDSLKRKDDEGRLGAISSDALAFFSGLVLPGPTFPFLIMNTLIDLDPDPATDELALLSHTRPNCGFQYRNSHTYWSASCVVGRVLAPTCRSVAGWVGPARPTADLDRSQIVRIRSRRPPQSWRQPGGGAMMSAEDVESMTERSDPLGPAADAYPVGDYELPVPQTESGFAVDSVRIERLGFKPVTSTTTTSTNTTTATDNTTETTDTTRTTNTAANGSTAHGPAPLYDASIQFAINGLSWPLRLMYDVHFVSAWPCAEGPHPLFFDYLFDSVRIDELVRVHDWGSRHNRRGAHNGAARGADKEHGRDGEGDDDEVLVVEAFGVGDNEALARAWCSHWGLSAVVADVSKTCMACAIREAYAATLTVVILVDERLCVQEEE
ncbi:hypothetical protein HIM_05058 [Hirsutella minnesotensis 3608]|uniref:Uncharacterized protein n=1 Tax=Hirsutella minnesotensis 3608 TaxID=1043627 RepID=A0A0F7ZPJ2_9HYPO|nr:hypothetical protein HIM_05058 [Hirsutella minnesotensis 3608]